MKAPFKYMLLAAITVVCSLLTSHQYNQHRAEQERLVSNGIRVPLDVQFSMAGGVKLANITFTTTEGRQIKDSRKCAGDQKKYAGAKAIYNPENPSEYALSFDLDSYSPGMMLIFYFLICLPAMIFIGYRFILAAYKVIRTLAEHRSR